jgi:Flp pilus assembly protein TadG
MFHRRHRTRRGVAALELAIVFLFLLIPLLFGVWEVGRLIQVQQIVSNSAREGARLAAQGYTININGAPTQIMTSTGSPNVHDFVYDYLIAAGFTNLSSSDVTVTFQFLAPRSDGNPATEPYQGEKGQPMQVTVSIPWPKVRWINMGMIDPPSVTYTAVWRMAIDDPFTVNANLPTY